MNLPDVSFLGNDLEHWSLGLAATAVTILALRLILALLISRLGALARRTSTDVDDALVDALRGTKWLILVAAGLVAGSRFLETSDRVDGWIGRGFVLVLILQTGLWISGTAVGWLHRYRDRKIEDDKGAATSVGAMVFLSRLVVWSVTLLVALDNVGVNVTGLITGLGIGGIAVALALQNVLGDLFASLSIVWDKPFVIGDFVIVDDMLGTVENVGLKTTRIRSLGGEQLVFANNDLLGSRIRNYGRMKERRVVFKLGVTYGTALEHLKAIPGLIKEAIEDQEKTRFDRSHFASYGDFSLIFESVYYVLEPDYNLYMDIQQAINLALREKFTDEGIEFAFPTQTLHVHGVDAYEVVEDGTGEENGGGGKGKK